MISLKPQENFLTLPTLVFCSSFIDNYCAYHDCSFNMAASVLSRLIDRMILETNLPFWYDCSECLAAIVEH